jgi:chromate transporter
MSEGIALRQLDPGPMMVDFVGYQLRGVRGALLATLGFVSPSFVLIVQITAAYFGASDLSWVHPLFLGVEAAVIGVLLHVTLDLGARALRGWRPLGGC